MGSRQRNFATACFLLATDYRLSDYWRPCLRKTAPREVRSLCVEDFRNVAETAFLQMGFKTCEEAAGLISRCGSLAKCFHPGCHEWAQQEGPDRALVIGAVAVHHAAFVSSAIARIVR